MGKNPPLLVEKGEIFPHVLPPFKFKRRRYSKKSKPFLIIQTIHKDVKVAFGIDISINSLRG